ncbi:hypothetical protein [Futiania mangrovi]|uniref:Uncharacterized protein n=1 Tax=Futiania mangrovi TaxID=2959716 RepID=A0A9J6PD00_9PROT|nr:hypothetical protein [Futiania mangrovii]MCP1335547.1 hypothetical protein [Futiania mangrovii]
MKPAARLAMLLLLIALLLAAHQAMAPRLLSLAGAAACVREGLSVACAFPDKAPAQEVSLALLAGALTAFALAGRVLPSGIVTPFVLLLSFLLAMCAGIDALAETPARNLAGVFSHTLNVVTLAVAGSLAGLAFLFRPPLHRMALVAIPSFFLSSGLLSSFLLVRDLMPGAAGLLLLFLLYAFGGFVLHLMLAAGLLAGAAEASRPAR